MLSKLDSMQVPLGMHLLSGLVDRTRSLWVKFGNLETARYQQELQAIEIDRPVYVTGLARAGTTILLEFLARHDRVATHKYRDFPGVFTPVWWNQGQSSAASAEPQERAHGDGLAVTPDSPEAIEEMLWMQFFPQAHLPQQSSVLDASTTRPDFEPFYRDHLRKLLWVRDGTRYVAKGNYNFTRMLYLQKLFPDARFVVAIREPRSHIASLMKQHKLFSQGERHYPRALDYMRRVGHYEFGLDRRPINVGNHRLAQEVQDDWRLGDEVRGWARYWAGLYGWLAEQLTAEPDLAAAVTLVRYETLCDEPAATLAEVLDHCELDDVSLVADFAGRIAAPQYYQPDFSAAEEATIDEETGEVARRFDELCNQQSTQLLPVR